MSLGRSIHSRGVGGLKIGMGLYAGWSGKEAVGSTVVSSGLGLGFLVVDGGGAVEIVILKMVKKLVFQTIFNRYFKIFEFLEDVKMRPTSFI